MNEIDFVIAIGITIAVITFVIFYTINTFNSDTTAIRLNELQYAKASIADQLLQSYLTEDFKHADIMLRDLANSTHTENIRISLEPNDVGESIHLYDDQLNGLDSSVSENSNNITVIFSTSISPLEKKHVNLFYRGNATSKMTYETNFTAKNITGVIVSEHDEKIISYDKCSALGEKTMDQVKGALGIEHYFQLELDGCNFGPSPPETDVAVESIPVLREDSSGRIVSDIAILRVWL